MRQINHVLAVALTVLALTMQSANTEQPPASTNRYADPAACAQCHAQIANTFRETGMGRSFYRLTPANTVEDFTVLPFYHEASHTWFTMTTRGGRFYQRHWQTGSDGREIDVDEKQVDYVMGSGNHGRTYLHLTSRNTLQQLPLGWYSEKGGYWAMSPGFDRPDYPGSLRVVTYECMFCHNAYPKIPAGREAGQEERDAAPEFALPLPEGIDCQRCHGPGLAHIQTATRPGARPAEIRAAIVNPKKLAPEREMEVCLQCHLETTTEALPHDMLRLGRAPFSYLPGQPLGDFRLTFDRAGGMGERFEIAHAAYRMRESQCFLKSQGTLRCTTCHDPHNIPRGAEAAAHYNGVCRDCHAAAFVQTVAAGRHTNATNCIECHMPKRRADDAVYMVMTDHLIRARQPDRDLVATKTETPESARSPWRGEVVPYYPAKIGPTEEDAALYSAVAQIRETSNLQGGLPLLESLIAKYRPQRADFYVDLAEALTTAGDKTKALHYFEVAVQHAPRSAIVLRKAGRAQMDAGQTAKAEATLRQAVALAPRDSAAWGLLGQLLWQRKRTAEARTAFLKALDSDPEVPALHGSFGAMLFAQGDLAGAKKEFREAVRLQPGVAKMESSLASVLAAREEIPDARFYFEQAIRLKPDLAEARLNFARMLASHGEAGEAEVQVKAALDAERGLSGAHQLWGSLLATRGDLTGALRELNEAVRLQPDLWRAQFELGVVMGRLRDYAGGEEHLKIAARGTDLAVKADAEQLLRRLGR